MFNEVLRELRKNSGLSQEDLAHRLGISKSAVGMYEQDKRKPNHDLLKKIAACFEVSIDYLMDYSPEGYKISSEDFSRYGISPITTKKFPMIGEIACGEPIMCEKNYETFVEASGNINADFCLVAKGDSMINARIFDGDVVFIREQSMVENGEVAAVIVDDDEITLKRFYYYPEAQRVVLSPENPKYSPLVYEGERLNHIRVLGKAVAFTSQVL